LPSAAPLEDAAFPYGKLSFDASRAMVERAKMKGVNSTWLPVPGVMRTDACAQPEIIAKIFDFFDAHKTDQVDLQTRAPSVRNGPS
jgi:hypothetical protein